MSSRSSTQLRVFIEASLQFVGAARVNFLAQFSRKELHFRRPQVRAGLGCVVRSAPSGYNQFVPVADKPEGFVSLESFRTTENLSCS